MKKLLGFLLLCALSASASVSVVQSATGSASGSSSTFTKTLSWTVTAHTTLLIHACVWSNVGTAPTINTPTDTLLNTMTLEHSTSGVKTGSSSSACKLWRVKDSLGGTETSVTFTVSGGGGTIDPSIVVVNVSGLDLAASNDGEGTGVFMSGGGSTNFTSAFTTTNATDWFFAWGYNQSTTNTFSGASATPSCLSPLNAHSFSTVDGESQQWTECSVSSVQTNAQFVLNNNGVSTDSTHSGLIAFKLPSTASKRRMSQVY
jgi:hypothetical protein